MDAVLAAGLAPEPGDEELGVLAALRADGAELPARGPGFHDLQESQGSRGVCLQGDDDGT